MTEDQSLSLFILLIFFICRSRADDTVRAHLSLPGHYQHDKSPLLPLSYSPVMSHQHYNQQYPDESPLIAYRKSLTHSANSQVGL